ncbi:trans-aconitate methyltransferase 1 [Coemansia sp. RSA 1933]|nr:trans-aconitate methyltransferase 1 [Coemansia sp. RSA 1933]
MSAFASKGFNANAYLALRPTYNQALMEWLFKYHAGTNDSAADIACGPGTFTVDLAKRFGTVVGVDPSSSMIASAQEDANSKGISNVQYKQGFGEQLPIESGSVDLLTVMQGVHWFDIEKFLGEALRVLRPGGTLVIVGYDYPEIVNWPASLEGRAFAHKLATDSSLLQQYWDRGFDIVEKAYAPLLRTVQTATGFGDIEYVGSQENPSDDVAGMTVLSEPWIDSKDMSFSGFRAYLKTWSAYKGWKDANASRDDILDAYFDEKQRELRKSGQSEEAIAVEWPHFAVVARKQNI